MINRKRPLFFSSTLDFPPKTVRGLLRRRNKALTELVEKGDFSQGQVLYFTQKINIAFEILKCEVEGTEEHTINTLRWRGECR